MCLTCELSRVVSVSCGGDKVDFDESAPRQCCDLNRRACGSSITDPSCVDLVDDGKVGHVVKVDCGLHDIGPGQSCGVEYSLQVLHDALCLSSDVSVHHLSRRRIEPDLSRREEEAS